MVLNNMGSHIVGTH